MRRYQHLDAGRRPFRTVRWLGSEALDNPLIRMLHEYRARMTARDRSLPVEERPAYRFRQARVYAKGRDLGPAQSPPAVAPLSLQESTIAELPAIDEPLPERPGDGEPS